MEKVITIKQDYGEYKVFTATRLLKRPTVSVLGFDDGTMRIVRNDFIYNSSERALKDCVLLNSKAGEKIG